MAGALAIALALIFAILAPPARAEIAGRASVIDGDTIEIQGQRIRLFGIDAPESDQHCLGEAGIWRCGQQAALMLQSRISAKTVTCREKDKDRYGRIVAVCRVEGQDLNAWIVAEGWALAYRDYSMDYVADEDRAREGRKGMWRSRFVAPWEWRKGKHTTGPRADAQEGRPTLAQLAECGIKANISSAGERIYHLPGSRSYEATVINPARGERWFCTEAEARAAGWRRAIR